MPLAVGFLQHVLEMNSSDVAYFSFDFHFRCRGLRFQKVSFQCVASEPVIHPLTNVDCKSYIFSMIFSLAAICFEKLRENFAKKIPQRSKDDFR